LTTLSLQSAAIHQKARHNKNHCHHSHQPEIYFWFSMICQILRPTPSLMVSDFF